MCSNSYIPQIVALHDRLVGYVYLVELIMERGHPFESNEAAPMIVPELFKMNPHVGMARKFTGKIKIDGLKPNQGCWFMSCNACGWKVLEEGAAYRCTKEKCIFCKK